MEPKEKKTKKILWHNKFSSFVVKFSKNTIREFETQLKNFSELKMKEKFEPHICVIHPFVSYYYYEMLESELSGLFEPFELVFKQIGYFKTAKSFSIHVKPDDNEGIMKVREYIYAKYNLKNHQKPNKFKTAIKYTPHLTLYRGVRGKDEDEMKLIVKSLQSKWKTVKCKITEIHLTSRLLEREMMTRHIIPFKNCEVSKEYKCKKLSKKCSVIVGVSFPFFNFGINESDLFELFKGYSIERIHIQREKETKKDKGWAVMMMESKEEKEKIVNKSSDVGFEMKVYGKKFKIYVNSFY